MLSAHATEVVAFITDGGVIHRDCLPTEVYEEAEEYREERAVPDGGIGRFVPSLYDALEELGYSAVIRYSLDEWASEQTWDYLAQMSAEELEELADDPEGVAELKADFENPEGEWHGAEGWAEYLRDSRLLWDYIVPITCDDCWEAID